MLWSLREIIFVRLILPFSAGIISYILIPLEFRIEVVVALFILSFLLLLVSHSHARFTHYKWRWLSGVAIFPALFFSGVVLCAARTELNHDLHFSNNIQHDHRLIIELTEPLVKREKSYKSAGNVKFLVSNDSLINSFGRVAVYFKMDTAAAALEYGDVVLAENKIAALPDPKNPGEFDYKKFMGFRQIHHQIYLTPDDWIISDMKSGNKFMNFVLSLRKKLSQILETHHKDEDALAVSLSLILGIRDRLSDNIVKAYSNTGTIHVLAVSGLHVAIIYFLINHALFFLDKFDRGKYLKALLTIFMIWLYAFITGLSPSVLRAAVMFSFVIVGKTLKRNPNIFNILAAAAFFLLLFNPYLIMDLGFQLSFAAVIGIVIIQPRLYKIFFTSNWLLDKIWSITSVSIAAQIATFPIAVLYFHQFPVYFLLANLIVIPSSMFILYGGVFLFAIFWMPLLSDLTGFSLEKLVYFTNEIIFLIDSFPHAVLEGISISIIESWFIYLALGSLLAFIYYRKNSFIFSALVAFVLLLSWNLVETIAQLKQKKLIVYNIPKISAIDFIHGKEHFFLSDTPLLNDEEKLSFHIAQNWWEHGLQEREKSSSEKKFIFQRNEYIQFLDKKIILLNDKIITKPPAEKLTVDYVVVSKNPGVTMKEILANFDAKKFIFDSSNFRKNTSRWMRQCEKLNLDCYDVNSKGAFVAKF